jgi:hypothetical protein
MASQRNLIDARDQPSWNRRDILQSSGLGFAGLALSWLLNHESSGNVAASAGSTKSAPSTPHSDLVSRTGHFSGRANAVIQLYQEGGPSQVDLFDPKPELVKRNGQPLPGEVEAMSTNNRNVLLASPFRFQRFGECGMELSELIANLGSVADELCLVRSMHTEHNNHPEAHAMMQTCKTFAGRPVLGAWISYALGTANQSLPAYVVLRDPRGYGGNTKRSWTNGWLPAIYQGVEFSSRGKAVHHLTPSEPIPPDAQRNGLDLLSKLNATHLRNYPGDTELEARIRNYELAARMQMTATAALDLSQESAATRSLYGVDQPTTADYGTRCLMARRLVESGVRFVQVIAPLEGNQWDHHGQIKENLTKMCAATDQPAAALIKDLKSRGLLETTIVMWTGEFGRLPTTENADGRDHNRHGFSLLLAGGGFKAGQAFGETDEFGYKAAVNRVSVPDLHATVLHQLGIDHHRLTYPYHGRNETLTDPSVSEARIVAELLDSPPQL